jgi:hypothetical protein
VEREESGQEELSEYADQADFWNNRLIAVRQEIKQLDNELIQLRYKQKELNARRAVLVEARRSLYRRTTTGRNKNNMQEAEFVRRDELAVYLARYLDANTNGRVAPPGSLPTLAEKAGVSVETIRRIRYGKGGEWVTFSIADKLLTAMGAEHLLYGPITIHNKAPLTDD